jgi:hypothetical protein
MPATVHWRQTIMTDSALAQAVEAFAASTVGWPDEALERAWAWQMYGEGVRVAFFRTYEELRELAVTVAAERAARGPAISTAQRALGQYHLAYRDLQAVVLGVTDADLDRAPAEGQWPLRAVLGHMIRADSGFLAVTWHALDQHRRGIVPVQAPTQAMLEAYWGDAATAVQQALAGPLAGILAYHARIHDRVMQDLGDITDGELSVPSLWWEEEEMSLRFRLHRFDSHLRQHTVQAEKTLDAIGRPPTEAKRLLRLIYAALSEAEGASLGAPDTAADERRAIASIIAARAEEMAKL